MQIKIADIVADPAMQHRPMNQEYVDALVQALATGSVPPIQVIRSGSQFILWDGFHRLDAHKRSGFTDIDADVYDGDRLAAWKASLGANSRHGLRRDRDEIVRIVAACLKNPETAYLKNADLAELIDVSTDMVRKIKNEIRDEATSVAEGLVATESSQASVVPDSTVTGGVSAAAVPAPECVAQEAGEPLPHAAVRTGEPLSAAPSQQEPPKPHFRRKQIAIVRTAMNKLIPALEELNLFDQLRAELVRIKEAVGLV